MVYHISPPPIVELTMLGPALLIGTAVVLVIAALVRMAWPKRHH